jgi:Na+-translocating ferredoxin:NAD+ oxidoreductase RNF subunit RnfB
MTLAHDSMPIVEADQCTGCELCSRARGSGSGLILPTNQLRIGYSRSIAGLHLFRQVFDSTCVVTAVTVPRRPGMRS